MDSDKKFGNEEEFAALREKHTHQAYLPKARVLSKPLAKVGSNKRFVREWLKPNQERKTQVEQKEAQV